MAGRSSSPRMIGRDVELAAVADAVRRGDDDRPVVLLEGEAGIGKTRLLTEVFRQLEQTDSGERPIRVVLGSCLELAEGELPFAPILEILDAVARSEAPSAAAASLRDVLSGAGSGPGSMVTDSRARRFIDFRELLISAAPPGGLVVAIDDLHWADRSTLDLVVFLARRLRGTRVVLVLAYRSDELHRRHPLRPILAQLARGFVRERIELGPLDGQSIADQVSELRGGSADRDLVEQIIARADGNPFHAEELVALGFESGPLPASLRDVLLARLNVLDPNVVEVLGSCAVVGRLVDEALLDAIVQLDRQDVRDAIRAAVDRSLLEATGDGRSYRFRHALLREAVYEDLLPVDRIAAHRRVAETLVNRPDLAASSPAVAAAELARHRDAAGQTDLARDAYAAAGDLAFRASAWAEAAEAFERAFELGVGTGSNRLDRLAADRLGKAALAVHWSGDSRRAEAMLRRAMASLQTTDDIALTADLWIVLSDILNDAGEEPASREAFERARELISPNERSRTKATVLAAAATEHMMAGRYRAAIRVADQAIEMGQDFGAVDAVVRALAQRASSEIWLGRPDDGLATYERAREVDERTGSPDPLGVAITNTAWALADAGEFERASERFRRALAVAAEFDLSSSWDRWNLPGLAYCAFAQGRWTAADEYLAAARVNLGSGLPRYSVATTEAMLAVARGRLDLAAAALAESDAESSGWQGDILAHAARAAATWLRASGDLAGCLSRIDDGLASLEALDDTFFRSSLAAFGTSVAADLAEQAHGRRKAGLLTDARERATRYAALADAIASERLIDGARSVPLTRANGMIAAAEAQRALGHDNPFAWPSVIAAFEDLGMAPDVAYLNYRLGHARLTAADGAGATVALRAAQEIAARVGMTVLRRDISALARLGRIELEPRMPQPPRTPVAGRESARPASSADPWGLSTREREVLALLADGRTNGEIGQVLFISTKTASVHVTHILDKLGVSSRTEAALLAVRAGMIADDETASPSHTPRA